MARPNVLIILSDDLGYSDIGCYGGEIETPNLDRLAAGGVRFTQFYNTARCCPSRASLLTGLHPHQAGVGDMTGTNGPDGYEGTLNRRCTTVAEVLRDAGYATYMSGKWHVVSDIANPNDAWPRQRGFERFYGTITGAASYYAPMALYDDETNIDQQAFDDPDYYFTDAISENAARFVREHAAAGDERPFLLYTAFTCPHWPLHAREEDVEKYRGRFAAGWDRLREERLERMVASGIIDPKWRLSPRDPAQPPWEDASDKEWYQRRMEVYAAQVHRMDVGIGRILKALEETGQLDDTLVIYLADNGGCHEEIGESGKWFIQARIARAQTRDGRKVRFGNRPDIAPGGEDTYTSYGVPWANLSNTPFRMYKCWTHEGGISTPFIVHWPKGLAARGEVRSQPAYLPDIMATLVDVAGATYPATRDGHDVPPLEGTSLRPFLEDPSAERDGMMFWEHEGNAAVRDGRWKLVRNFNARRSGTRGFDPEGKRGAWELYDMLEDRTELADLAGSLPDRVREMSAAYDKWAARCGVMGRDELLERLRARKG